jgi:hypothetical protein
MAENKNDISIDIIIRLHDLAKHAENYYNICGIAKNAPAAKDVISSERETERDALYAELDHLKDLAGAAFKDEGEGKEAVEGLMIFAEQIINYMESHSKATCMERVEDVSKGDE